jgi:hypothetical protein
MSPDGRVAPEAPRAYVQAMPLLAQELQVEGDYGQIYIYDPETQLADEDTTEEEYPPLLALEDAHESRRFVGYARGLIDVCTPSQYNWSAPMRLEVSEEPPASDTDRWDHVVELPLPAPSGRLVFQASGGGKLIETQIPPGNYRARFSGRGYSAVVGEIEGHESYRLQLWPSQETVPRLVKYWHGYHALLHTE